MKKVLFCLQTMVRGGVEKELLTISKMFPKDDYEITVAIMYESLPEMSLKILENNVRFVNLDINKDYHCSGLNSMVVQRIRKGKLSEAIKIAVLHSLRIEYVHTAANIDDIEIIKEHFDIAVCYHMHSPIVVKYVAQKVDADKKYLWMHNDLSTSGFQPVRINKYLKHYDLIVGCSKQVSNEFISRCPKYKDKVKTVYNILDYEEIINLAKEDIKDERFNKNSGWILVTVGRYTEQKGYEDAIKACKLIVDEGINVKWFCIGSGKLEEHLRAMIEQRKMEQHFVLLGEKENPYPYMSACDIYVQPSRHEGYGLTIHEARILNKPIVCTDFVGAKEQVENDVTATIVPICNPDALAKAIIELINNSDKRDLYMKNLCELNHHSDFNNLLMYF